MITRCSNKNRRSFKDYGGRGISVSKDWSKFENFSRDMADGYIPGLTLERIDVNGNYCKENCVWATRKQQARNKRNNRRVTYHGREMTVVELAEETNTHYFTLMDRLKVQQLSAEHATE